MNCVFTGFDESYWDPWGSSWVYTLREIARYKGEACIVDCGLSALTKDKIKQKNISIIKSEENGSTKIKAILEIAKYSRKNKGNFVYWDADAFFESPIDEIFLEIKNKIIISENMNLGFIGAPYYHWAFMEDLVKFIRLTKRGRSIEDLLTNDFGNFVEYVSNTWNFTELNQLDKIKVGENKPKVIHPTEILKSTLSHKNFLFHERENKEYLDFVGSKKKFNRRLIKKKK